MLQKKNYPIVLLKEIEQMLKHFYEAEFQFQDLITIKFNEPHIVEAKDVEDSKFRFLVTTPSINSQGKCFCKITKCPRGAHSLEEFTSTVLISEILKHFQSWIKILKDYNTITLTKEDWLFQLEASQFFEEFEMLDQNETFTPLTVNNQLEVFELLETMQRRLLENEVNAPEVKEIFEDVETLKKQLASVPAKEVGKRVARIMAKTKKIGFKLFKDIVDVAYKEAIKNALRGGLSELNHFIT